MVIRILRFAARPGHEEEVARLVQRAAHGAGLVPGLVAVSIGRTIGPDDRLRYAVITRWADVESIRSAGDGALERAIAAGPFDEVTEDATFELLEEIEAVEVRHD